MAARRISGHALVPPQGTGQMLWEKSLGTSPYISFPGDGMLSMTADPPERITFS